MVVETKTRVAGKIQKPEPEDTALPLSKIRSAKVRETLDELCTQVRTLTEEIDALDKAKKELMKQVADVAVEHDLEKVRGNGWLLNFVVQHKSTIKPELLLEQGVSMDQIQKSTVTTETSYYSVLKSKS